MPLRQTSAAGATTAPDSAYASSVKLAASPAPGSTATTYPSPISWATVVGVAATRVSPTCDSFTTPITAAGGVSCSGSLIRRTLSVRNPARPLGETRVSFTGPKRRGVESLPRSAGFLDLGQPDAGSRGREQCCSECLGARAQL